MMELGYRIPIIDEFVQGFEFEYYDNTSYRMIMLDFSPGGKAKDLTPRKEVGWIKRIVNWKHSPDKRIIETFKDDDGNNCTLEYSGFTANWFNEMCHRDIQKLIDDGRIRVKK